MASLVYFRLIFSLVYLYDHFPTPPQRNIKSDNDKNKWGNWYNFT